MDSEDRYAINQLISQQVTKEPILQTQIINKLKGFMKKSDEHVKLAFDQMFLHLEANNSQVSKTWHFIL